MVGCKPYEPFMVSRAQAYHFYPMPPEELFQGSSDGSWPCRFHGRIHPRRGKSRKRIAGLRVEGGRESIKGNGGERLSKEAKNMVPRATGSKKTRGKIPRPISIMNTKSMN